jgi:16S rRNA (cytosine1402-N4)-methyltransferase
MLAIHSGGTYVDGTLGGGGHAEAILTTLRNGTFIGIDKDDAVLRGTADRLHNLTPKVTKYFVNDGFENISVICNEYGVRTLNGVLLDLGWGSHTLESGRGFSFQKDEPLLMTYGTPKDGDLTALTIVNEWSEEALVAIFRGWGEEPRSRQAAAAICSARDTQQITTTGQLLAVLAPVLPRTGKTHPTTRVFQALRIAVNKELQILEPAFRDCLSLLAPRSRLCVITFHSGEDRLTKHLFNEWHEQGLGTHLTRKVIAATREEALRNPRARSAKLRVFEKH